MLVLLDTLADMGGDVRGVLNRSGLGPLERAAREGRATLIPRAGFAKLASDCVLALHTESCRKNRLKTFPVRNHRILLMAMLGCSTLREAVGIITDFYAMLGEGSAQWTVSIDDNVVNFALERRTREKSIAECLISLFSLATYHRILGWVIGGEVPLVDVTLAFPDMLAETSLLDLFTVNPRFSQRKDGFSFAEQYLDWPIARKSSEIDDLFALFPFDLMPPDYGTDTLKQRLAGTMRASLSVGDGIPDMQTMARMFGLTPATLRRRLAREGTSLVALRIGCRRDLAMALLAGTSFTVSEIASRLQYADVATFRRAFLGWTTLTPSAWRETTPRHDETIGLAGPSRIEPR